MNREKEIDIIEAGISETKLDESARLAEEKAINVKSEEDINEDNENEEDSKESISEDMVMILPYLYIGGEDVAINIDFLKKNKIGHIINCVSYQVECPFEYSEGFTYTKLSIRDAIDEPINKYFEQIYETILNEKEKHNILVHDLEKGSPLWVYLTISGHTIAACLVIAYMIKAAKEKKMKLSLKGAYEHCVQKVPEIELNNGFTTALISYEKQLFGAVSMVLAKGKIGKGKGLSKKMRGARKQGNKRGRSWHPR